MPKCDYDRSLVMWLIAQERVMRLWIEEAASKMDADLAGRLEIHRRWLSAQIGELSKPHVAT